MLTTSLKRILGLTKEYYIPIFIYSITISVLNLATPISVQWLVNTISFGPYFQPLFIVSLLLLGILSVLGVIYSLQYLLIEYLQRNVYAKVTASVGRYFFVKSKKEGLTERDMFLANRYYDVVIIQKSLSSLTVEFITIFLQVVIGVVLISLYHPYFVVFGLMIIASIYLGLVFTGKHALKTAYKESSIKHDVAEYLETLCKDMSRVDNPNQLISEMDQQINSYLDTRSSHFRILFSQNIVFLIFFAVFNALLLGLGGYLVVKGSLTVGQLVAAEIVISTILYHFLYAKKYLDAFYDMHAALEKVDVFYDDEILNYLKTDEDWCHTMRSEEGYHQKFESIGKIFTPKNTKRFARNFSIGLTVFMVVLLVTPWMQFSNGTGTVTALNPNNRAQTIRATVKGRIEEWLVQDGQVVSKGDPIVRIVDNDPNYLTRLETQRDAAVKKFEAAKVSSDTARLNFHRQEKLMEQGLSSRKAFEKSEITYRKLIAEEASAAANLAKTEVDLSRQQLQIITAPRDGRILRILRGSGNVNVKEGEDIAQFVPDNSETVVELFLDGNDLPLVFPGRKVRLQFEGWPAIQFAGWPAVAIGSFGGVVQVVDPFVGADGRFRVMVTPDEEDPYNWPDQTFLRQGARAMGVVILDQVTIGYELWRVANGFPKSLPQAPDQLKKRKN